MITPEEKLDLIRKILLTDDERLIEQIKRVFRKDNLADGPHAYASDENMTFGQWMSQYMGATEDLSRYLPEYDMTLAEFRRHVFEQERRSHNID